MYKSDGPQVKALPESIGLADIEIKALKAVIDTQHLNRKNLSQGERGEILDSEGKQLFPVGLSSAIEKILTIHGGNEDG